MTTSGVPTNLTHAWPYKNRRILIADDQPELHDDFREILVAGDGKLSSDELAAAFGHRGGNGMADGLFLPEFELAHAFNGLEACELVEEHWQAGRPFALAFVDLRMPPGMDGVEAIQRIRQTDRDIEIVVMTAYSDRTLREIVSSTDLSHKMLYVRKPFTHEEIQQVAMCLVGKWNVERALAKRHQEIADTNRTLEAVLEATDDAMVMFDESGRFVLANHRFEEICGLPQAELTTMSGKALRTKLKERFAEPSPVDIQVGLAVEAVGGVVELKGRQSLQGLFYRSKAVVKDEHGTAMGRLEVYRDVSKDVEIQRMRGEVMRLRGELRTTHSFGEMVGGSRKIRELYGLIRQAAASDVTVLIHGETGTGKELVAQSFHENSNRSDGPFLAVNCAAIPENLVESELFGHEKGAFTGANWARRGAFERAEGGTLFLDEIGEMQSYVQSKLLRVLQEREFERVGGSRVMTANVRVLAATNQDLEREVAEGAFRNDLFYRLSVFPVTVPPLRDRKEDIPLLAGHFLRKQAEDAGKSIDGVSTAAMRMLLQYDWPGNVRELANVIERAVLLETDRVIQPGSLPNRLVHAASVEIQPEDETVRSTPTLAVIEREALANAMVISGGNVTQAARGLGINRSTLYRKLKRHGLRPKES